MRARYLNLFSISTVTHPLPCSLSRSLSPPTLSFPSPLLSSSSRLALFFYSRRTPILFFFKMPNFSECEEVEEEAKQV